MLYPDNPEKQALYERYVQIGNTATALRVEPEHPYFSEYLRRLRLIEDEMNSLARRMGWDDEIS